MRGGDTCTATDVAVLLGHMHGYGDPTRVAHTKHGDTLSDANLDMAWKVGSCRLICAATCTHV